MLEFPAMLRLGPLALPPHPVFELLAYLLGARLYRRLKRREGDPLADDQRWWVVAAAAVGAALGGKLLFWASDPALTLAHWQDPLFLMAGKSVVGALIGALLAVEGAKKLLGVSRSSGDLFALPLCLGIAVGRVGCFLTGLEDHTHGLPTTLPWGVDFGDGIPRHPAQLYEIAFLGLLALAILRLRGRPHRAGDLFVLFMVGYLGFRLLLEFIKPGIAFGGLNAIQWACLVVLIYYAALRLPRLRRAEVSAHA